MASTSQSAAAPQADHIPALKTALYEACLPFLQDNPKIVFHQTDIFDLGVIPKDDVQILLQVTQTLLDEKLFKVVHDGDGMGWKLRTVEEAKKYRSLTAEQEMVYTIIDEAGGDGTWSKTIKGKSGLHEATFQSAIKVLRAKSLISEMKSVEHPTRKMYIKSNLSPSERATGGPWYTDGELDEEFIETVMKILYSYIMKRTFYVSKSMQASLRTPKKVVKKMTPEEAKAVRDKGLGARGKEVGSGKVDEKTQRKLNYESMLPMPAGYQGYPTVYELTLFVENGQYFTQILTANDIQTLLDIMCYDDKIERVISGSEGISYKALRKSLLDEDERSSVLSEAPCGRCPVFDLCEEGGPVGPSNCEYFGDWLMMRNQDK